MSPESIDTEAIRAELQAWGDAPSHTEAIGLECRLARHVPALLDEIDRLRKLAPRLASYELLAAIVAERDTLRAENASLAKRLQTSERERAKLYDDRAANKLARKVADARDEISGLESTIEHKDDMHQIVLEDRDRLAYRLDAAEAERDTLRAEIERLRSLTPDERLMNDYSDAIAERDAAEARAERAEDMAREANAEIIKAMNRADAAESQRDALLHGGASYHENLDDCIWYRNMVSANANYLRTKVELEEVRAVEARHNELLTQANVAAKADLVAERKRHELNRATLCKRVEQEIATRRAAEAKLAEVEHDKVEILVEGVRQNRRAISAEAKLAAVTLACEHLEAGWLGACRLSGAEARLLHDAADDVRAALGLTGEDESGE